LGEAARQQHQFGWGEAQIVRLVEAGMLQHQRIDGGAGACIKTDEGGRVVAVEVDISPRDKF
jgi:hypothetical protein